MKIRTGFVSNSSSSSFLIAGVLFKKENLTGEIANDFDVQENIDKFEQSSLDWNFDFDANKFLEDVFRPLEINFSQEDHEFYIGIPLSSMEDNETKSEFFNRVKNALNSVGYCTDDKINFVCGQYRV